jgi:hypothetical protein
MTREDLITIIVHALDRADTLNWRGKEYNHLTAEMILRGLRAAGVKMRGPVDYRSDGREPEPTRGDVHVDKAAANIGLNLLEVGRYYPGEC